MLRNFNWVSFLLGIAFAWLGLPLITSLFSRMTTREAAA